jgi:hypothetical protein
MARAITRNIAGMLQLASQADIEAGIEWYARAHRLASRLSEAYDLSLGQCVGVIAALSPRNKWNQNSIDAETMIKAWHYGIDPTTIKVCTFNLNKAKAAEILTLTDPSSDNIIGVLNGRKVVNFFKSIMGDPNAVCVDGHAYAIWIGERLPVNQTPKLGVGLYNDISRAYVLIAKRSELLCGEKLTPTQVQAVTWVTYRRLLGYN